MRTKYLIYVKRFNVQIVNHLNIYNLCSGVPPTSVGY